MKFSRSRHRGRTEASCASWVSDCSCGFTWRVPVNGLWNIFHTLVPVFCSPLSHRYHSAFWHDFKRWEIGTPSLAPGSAFIKKIDIFLLTHPTEYLRFDLRLGGLPLVSIFPHGMPTQYSDAHVYYAWFHSCHPSSNVTVRRNTSWAFLTACSHIQ